MVSILERTKEIILNEDLYPQGTEAKLAYTLPVHLSILETKKIFGINTK